ncbi:MAG: hypothetical protein IPM82_00365 [Saprospiraceae bacterium]|nr:hypothetical protein [Saprospiraceae bacterium]
MMKNILKLLVPNVLMLLAVGLQGQTTLQVVTKVMENTFPYKNGTEVNIEGEKAEIKVETWNRSEVKVLVELIAKHTDKNSPG